VGHARRHPDLGALGKAIAFIGGTMVILGIVPSCLGIGVLQH